MPDNLKSGVHRAHRYEPELNRAYAEFAEHYGVAILPARVRKPRDKAKVETGVLIVERWILARLRDRSSSRSPSSTPRSRSCSIELNERAVPEARRLAALALHRARSARAQGAAAARRTSSRSGSAPRCIPTITSKSSTRLLLRALQATSADQRRGAPHRARMVEIFASAPAHRRACPRLSSAASARRADAHRPANHRAVIDTTLGTTARARRRRSLRPSPKCCASSSTASAIPEEALRVAQGILRLAQDFSPAAARRACERALTLKSLQLPQRACAHHHAAAPNLASPPVILVHENVRGPDYFH